MMADSIFIDEPDEFDFEQVEKVMDGLSPNARERIPMISTELSPNARKRLHVISTGRCPSCNETVLVRPNQCGAFSCARCGEAVD